MKKFNNTINKLFNTRKKRNIFAVLLLGLVAVIGATIAYFGSNMDFKNLFSSKPFNTTVYEIFESPDSWTPGMTVPKEVYATNESEVDVKVRVSYTEQWLDANGNELDIEQNGNRAAIINLSNEEDWTKSGQYYNYNYDLKPGETTSSFMKSVTFNPEITGSYECTKDENGRDSCTSTGTGYDGATYKLIITVEMMQSDGEFYVDPKCYDDDTCIARIEDTKYVTLEAALDAAVDGDTIVMLNNTTESVINVKDVTLDLDGYTVTGLNDVTIQNNGKLKVIDEGKIENTTGTVIVNEGTLQLGDDDGEVSQTIPELIGTTIGIEQNGIFNFYDGVIEGIVAIAGDTTATPVDYYVFVDHNDERDCQRAYLVLSPDRGVVKTIENGEVYYFNLQDAINTSAITSYDIYAVRNFDAAYTLTIPENTPIVFDVIGLTVETGYTITNNGTLTLRDSAETKGALKPSVTIENNGTLNFKDITVTETTDDNMVNNNGIINSTNSTLTANAGHVIYNTGTTINLDENTTLKATNYAIFNTSEEELNITNGNIKGIKNEGVLRISNGIISSYGKSLYSIENGKVYIDGGTFTGQVYNEYSDITINKGTFKGSAEMIRNFRGNMTINDATLESTYYYGIRNEATLIINGGTYKAETAFVNVNIATINNGTFEGEIGIHNGEGTYTTGALDIKNATISGTDKAIINYGSLNIYDGTYDGTNIGLYTYNQTVVNVYGGKFTGGTYGIHNDRGIMTIGSLEDEVKIDSPVIVGNDYGINSTGTLYFYDGIFKGQTAGISNPPTAIPDGYIVTTGTETINDSLYNTAYLTEQANFVKVGDETFNSLQKAVDYIETSGTIEFILDASISSGTEIPAEKDITIDLAGHKIETTQRIDNNGILTIKDSSEGYVGSIAASTPYNLIWSQGTKLTIENVDITSTSNRAVINSDNSIYFDNVQIEAPSGYGVQVYESTEKNIIKNSSISSYNAAVWISGATESEITNTDLTSKYLYTAYLHAGDTIIDNVNITSTATYAITGGSNIITVKDSTITAKDKGIYYNGGTFNLYNTNITSEKYGVYNQYNNGTLNVYSGTIKGTTAGIESGSIVNVYGGTIEGGTNGIKGSTSASITIGTSDGEVDITSPVIIGGTYGIYLSNQKMYFYDGILKGVTDGYYGTIGTIEEDYTIEEGTEVINDVTYQTDYLTPQVQYAKVGDQTFTHINDAISVIDTEGTIEIINNAEITDTVTFPSGKTITLDLAGYNLKTTKQFVNEGALTITDSSELKDGRIDSVYAGYAFISKGTSFTINSGILSSTYTNYVLHLSGGNVVIDGGTISSTNGKGINIDSTTSFTMNDGTITTYGESITFKKAATINGGTIKSENANALNNTSTLTVNGGTISGSYGINNTGTTTITDGTITGSKYGIYNSGTLNINNGSVTGSTYGIYTTKNTSILGGYIKGNTYGIYAYGDGIQIGVDDGNISSTSPVIVGGNYGVYRKDTDDVYFYDGIIKGKVSGFYIEPVSIATNSDMIYGTESISGATYITNSLVERTNFIKNGATQYADLQTAIDEATSGDTLVVINNSVNYEDITIPADKEITIDLAGYNVGTTKTITNNGTLNITNSTDSKGTLQIHNGVNLIVNNNELNVEKINIKNVVTTREIIYSETHNSTTLLTEVDVNSKSSINIHSKSSLTIRKCNIEVVDTTAVSSYYTNVTIESSNINKDNTSDTAVSIGGYANETIGDVVIKDSNLSVTHISGNYSGTIINADITNTTITELVAFEDTKTTITGSAITNCFVSRGNAVVDNSTITGVIYSQGTDLEIKNNSTISNNVNNSDTNLIIQRWTANTTIKDSTIIYNSSMSKDRNVIYNESTGTLTIENSTIDIDNSSTNKIYGLYNSGTGTVNLNNSTMTMSSTKNNHQYGIYSNAEGTTNINSSTITIDSGTYGYGVYTEAGNVNLLGGSVNLNTTYSAYGVYANAGTFTLGTKDGNIVQDQPTITAVSKTGIGVKKINGYFMYYDGKITGSTNAKPETATEVEYLYEATTYTDETTGYEYCILVYME